MGITRTNIDFKNHQFLIRRSDICSIFELKKKDSTMESITFINSNGICAVTGDFGNWVFCREFHPHKGGYVSDYYWIEKLSSTQKGSDFNSRKTIESLHKRIQELDEIDEPDMQKVELEKEYIEDCLNNVDDAEFIYDFVAYNNKPYWMDSEDVIKEYDINPQLKVVFDGFEEMCNRMKLKETLDLLP